MPTFSIIMATWNRAGFLSRSVGSVLRQSFQDWELIIVDDASTDDTQAVLASLADPRIRVLRNDRNLERSASRNRGLAEAQGRYVCFLDSDDEWLPEHLAEHAAAHASAPEISLFSQAVYVGPDGAVRPVPLPPLETAASPAQYVLQHQPPIHTWSFLRTHLQEFPFDPALRVNEDVVAFVRLAARYPVARIDALTARYHLHGDNTHQPDRDTVSAELVAMRRLFADPRVRWAIPQDFRTARVRDLRHRRIHVLGRLGTRLQVLGALIHFLLRYPLARRNGAKIILVLGFLPGVGRIPRVRRAAEATLRAYY